MVEAKSSRSSCSTNSPRATRRTATSSRERTRRGDSRRLQARRRRGRRRPRCRGRRRTAARCIRLRPGAWISRITTAPSPHATCTPVVVDREHRARARACRPRRAARAEQLHVWPRSSACAPGHGSTPRIRAATARAGCAKSIAPSAFVSIARVRRARVILRRAACACPPRSPSIASSSAAAPIGASRASSSPDGLVGIDRDAALEQHRPGVHALVELHDRDAGLGLAVDHRPLHRRGAAILRQERARGR